MQFLSKNYRGLYFGQRLEQLACFLFQHLVALPFTDAKWKER